MKNFKSILDVLPPGRKKVVHTAYHRMPHYTYTPEDMADIKVEHLEPKKLKDKIAYNAIKMIRKSYDLMTSYNPNTMTKSKWVQRCLILETVAGVPGMVGGMARHLRSLRVLERDKGWIHQLLEEADNERFHLFFFLSIKQPRIMERIFIIALQGVFFNLFFLSYLVTPTYCHRFVGYLEEEAVKTYTAMLKDIDSPDGALYHWNKVPAPQEAIDYYSLPKNATFRDVIMCIKTDEAVHRASNHFLASIDQDSELDEEELKVINANEKEPDMLENNPEAMKKDQ